MSRRLALALGIGSGCLIAYSAYSIWDAFLEWMIPSYRI